MEDFIGISREISDHWIYKDSQYFHVWFEMLRCARYSPKPKNDIEVGVAYTINYAEFMFGYPSWSKRLKIGEQRLRTLIKLLIKDKMIVQIKKHPKFTIYFIVNYEKFNKQTNNQLSQQTSTIDEYVNNHTNKQLTTSQQPSNNLLTTKEEGCNKDKKDNKDIYITVQHLSMTETEYNKLVEQYGKSAVDEKIKSTENYAKLKNYKSLYLTLNKWLKGDSKNEKPQKEGYTAWGTRIAKE